jgi:hypothetical protein
MASTARWRAPPRSTGRPSASTSIGPSTRIRSMSTNSRRPPLGALGAAKPIPSGPQAPAANLAARRRHGPEQRAPTREVPGEQSDLGAGGRRPGGAVGARRDRPRAGRHRPEAGDPGRRPELPAAPPRSAPAGDRSGNAVVTDAAVLVALAARPTRRRRSRGGPAAASTPDREGGADETACRRCSPPRRCQQRARGPQPRAGAGGGVRRRQLGQAPLRPLPRPRPGRRARVGRRRGRLGGARGAAGAVSRAAGQPGRGPGAFAGGGSRRPCRGRRRQGRGRGGRGAAGAARRRPRRRPCDLHARERTRGVGADPAGVQPRAGARPGAG